MKTIDIVILLLAILLIFLMLYYFSNDDYLLFYDTPYDKLSRDGNTHRLVLPPFYNRGVPRIHHNTGWRQRWFS